MSGSWGHAVTRLSPDEIDEHDRWGRRCGQRCDRPVTHRTSYRYVTGRAGRVSLAERRMCQAHAERFAARHGVEVGDPAPARPDLRWGDQVESVQRHARLRRSPGHPAGEWSLSIAATGQGGFTSSSVLMFSSADGAGIEEAITAAEAFLVRRMLVPQEWRRSGEQATAELVPARDLPAWHGVSWMGTVLCEPTPRPTWYLELQLAAPFDPVRHPLGDTGMDLDRAVHTAKRELERAGWTLAGRWTRAGQVAAVHAHPPARPGAAYPAHAPSPGRRLAETTGGLVRPPAPGREAREVGPRAVLR